MKLEDLTTIDQLVDFLSGTQAVAFSVISDKDACYRWIQGGNCQGNCQGNCRLDGLTHAAFSNVSGLSLSSDLSGFKYSSSTGSQLRVSRLKRSGYRAFAAS